MATECPSLSRFIERDAGQEMHSKNRKHRSLSGFVLRAGQRRKRSTSRKRSRR